MVNSRKEALSWIAGLSLFWKLGRKNFHEDTVSNSYRLLVVASEFQRDPNLFWEHAKLNVLFQNKILAIILIIIAKVYAGIIIDSTHINPF